MIPVPLTSDRAAIRYLRRLAHEHAEDRLAVGRIGLASADVQRVHADDIAMRLDARLRELTQRRWVMEHLV